MSDSATAKPAVHVRTKYVPAAEPALPPLALQITELVGSCMVWVGATDEPAEKVGQAPLRGALTRDWVCAMPPTSGTAGAATTLYRNASSDAAFAMAQRLARRFKKQIFLSIDVPPAFVALGDGPRLLLAVERAVVDALKGLDDGGVQQRVRVTAMAVGAAVSV